MKLYVRTIESSCNSATNTCNIAAKDPIELSNPIEAEDNLVDEENYEPYDEGFGMDSNGEYIDESTVEELCRVAQEKLDASNILKRAFDYYEIDPDTWKENYHNTGSYSGTWLEYDISANTNCHYFYIADCYNANWDGSFPDLSANQDVYEALIYFTIHVKNDEVISVDMDADVIEHSRYDEYDSKKFFDAFDKDKIADRVAEYFEPVIRDIHVVVSNI